MTVQGMVTSIRMVGRLPSRVVFLQRSSFVKGCLPSKFVFRHRLSPAKGCLPSKVVFRQRSSSVNGVFCQRLSSFKGRLLSKVVFHQRSSFVKFFCKNTQLWACCAHPRWKKMKENTSSYNFPVYYENL